MDCQRSIDRDRARREGASARSLSDALTRNLARAAGQLNQFIKHWVRDPAGNVMLMFGLLALPIFVGAGAAVDASRAYLVQARLTQALDASGLAVGSMIGLTEAELQQRAEDFFKANYPVDEIGVPATPLVTLTENVLTVSATAKLPTAIMGIVGIHELNIASSVEITRESKSLELIMVLDNTGSMNSNDKIGALKVAANDLIDILFGSDPFPAKVKVGMVPFAAGVNVGVDFRNSGYMDTNGQSSIHAENFTPGTNLWDLYDDLSNRDWNGCVQTRPEPLDELDTVPTIGNPDTLWVPWFAPDEPSFSEAGDSYSNSYIDDGVTGDEDTRQRNAAKYAGQSVSSSSRGPQFNCSGLQAVTPLTNDRDLLLQRITDMVAGGWTHIPVGLAWGWRLVSPEAPFMEGTMYNDPDVSKAIILLTDGENTLPSKSNHNVSQYTAYGYVSEARLGTTNINTARAQLNPKTLAICENAKAEGVRLYTITFQLNNVDTQNMMEACATEPQLYFNSPSNEQLRLVFQNIAQDLSNLRLSK